MYISKERCVKISFKGFKSQGVEIRSYFYFLCAFLHYWHLSVTINNVHQASFNISSSFHSSSTLIVKKVSLIPNLNLPDYKFYPLILANTSKPGNPHVNFKRARDYLVCWLLSISLDPFLALIHSDLSWETDPCDLHSPQFLFCWLLVGYGQWEGSVGDRKGQEKEVDISGSSRAQKPPEKPSSIALAFMGPSNTITSSSSPSAPRVWTASLHYQFLGTWTSLLGFLNPAQPL